MRNYLKVRSTIRRKVWPLGYLVGLLMIFKTQKWESHELSMPTVGFHGAQYQPDCFFFSAAFTRCKWLWLLSWLQPLFETAGFKESLVLAKKDFF